MRRIFALFSLVLVVGVVMSYAVRRQIEDEVVALLAPLKKQTLGGGSGGYLRAVKEYNGEKFDDAALVNLRGQRPGILLSTGEGRYEIVNMARTRARQVLDVQLLVSSGTLRSREAQRQGGLATDEDPGVYKIAEDVRSVLMGKTSAVAGAGTYVPVDERPLNEFPDLTVWSLRYRLVVDVRRPADAAATLHTLVGNVQFPQADETLVAGTTGTLAALGGGVMQLTVTGTPFQVGMVGARAVIAGATTPANSGTFTITAVPSSGAIQFTNALGVGESFPGSWSVIPQPMLSIEEDNA